jgi:deoxyribose-phosphate aldolase
MESGELADPELIARASRVALAAGADFLKTSTGKTSVHATPQAAAVMLTCIAEHGRGGFKASGGLRRIADVLPYHQLAIRLLGESWVTPAHFRIGASSLLDDVCGVLRGELNVDASTG